MTTAGAYQLLFPPHVWFGWGVRRRLPELLESLLPGRTRPRLFTVASRALGSSGSLAEFADALDAKVVLCGFFDKAFRSIRRC